MEHDASLWAHNPPGAMGTLPTLTGGACHRGARSLSVCMLACVETHTVSASVQFICEGETLQHRRATQQRMACVFWTPIYCCVRSAFIVMLERMQKCFHHSRVPGERRCNLFFAADAQMKVFDMMARVGGKEREDSTNLVQHQS